MRFRIENFILAEKLDLEINRFFSEHKKIKFWNKFFITASSVDIDVFYFHLSSKEHEQKTLYPLKPLIFPTRGEEKILNRKKVSVWYREWLKGERERMDP